MLNSPIEMGKLLIKLLRKGKMIAFIYVLGVAAIILVLAAIGTVGYYNWNRDVKMAVAFSALVGIATIFITLFNIFKDLDEESQHRITPVFFVY